MEDIIWRLDQKINDKGIPVDTEALTATQIEIEKELIRLNEVCVSICGFRASQRNAIMDWVKSQGVVIPDLTKQTVKETLAGDLPADVRKVLKIRQMVGKTSTAKVGRLLNWTCEDGRVRNTLQYYGAYRTGRFAGRGPQIQNFPRGGLSKQSVEDALRMIRDGETYLGIDDLFDTVSSLLRAFIKAPEGRHFVVADLAGIEARVLPWLAEDEETLDIFRNGEDIYKFAAAQIYKKEYEDITKKERFVGKVATLSLGYGGGFLAFTGMAKTYGVIDMDEGFAETIKTQWRRANSKIVRLWRTVEKAAVYAVKHPNQTITTAGGRLKFIHDGDDLKIMLPSSRAMHYPKFSYTYDRYKGNILTHMGSTAAGWGELRTWGAKLCENITQAVARDVLAHSMPEIDKAGFEIVFHVHDEIVAEVDDGDEKLTSDYLVELMTNGHLWTKGLPLDAEGETMKRYRK
jgi:DNA polymerase